MKDKEGTRNFSKLLSESFYWKLEKFILLKKFPILKNFSNFHSRTRFTIICLEILLKIIENPAIEIYKIHEILSNKGYSKFVKRN